MRGREGNVCFLSPKTVPNCKEEKAERRTTGQNIPELTLSHILLENLLLKNVPSIPIA